MEKECVKQVLRIVENIPFDVHVCQMDIVCLIPIFDSSQETFWNCYDNFTKWHSLMLPVGGLNADFYTDSWPLVMAWTICAERLTQDLPRISPTSMKSSTGTTSSFSAKPLHMRQFICSGIAENDEVVAVEDFIDVGNILGKSWVSLLQPYGFDKLEERETYVMTWSHLILRPIPIIHETNALRGVLWQRVGKFLLKSTIALCCEGVCWWP